LTVQRKEWIESRLEELAGCFAVAIGGFSVMTNPQTYAGGPITAQPYPVQTLYPVKSGGAKTLAAELRKQFQRNA
jgi:hypothetical protein